MSIIEKVGSKDVIHVKHFEKCKIDNVSLEEMRKLYTGKDIGKKCAIYKMHKFIFHLKTKYNLSLTEYCKQYLDIEWKKCPITGLDVNYIIRSKDYITLNNYHETAVLTKSNSELVRNYCKKFSEERRGDRNPMFGKPSWNKGLKADNNEIIKSIANQRLGLKMSEESRSKMRQRRAENPLKARHTIPHSDETKEFLRKNTARLWAEGIFSKTSSIHIKMREFLKTINLIHPFLEEFQIDYYSVDFAFPDVKLAIECDGDYYHINPQFYPNGPETAVQRRNAGRDKRKNEWLKQQGWTVIRIWECEINAGSYKEKLICKLKELNLLKN